MSEASDAMAGDAMESLVLERHEELERAFVDALRDNPGRDVAGAMLVLRDETRIYVMDREQGRELATALPSAGLVGDFWDVWRSEWSDLFMAERREGRERLLVGQPSTGYVARLQFVSMARYERHILELERRARLAIMPPPTSATNVEALMMALGYLLPPPDIGVEPAEIVLAGCRSPHVLAACRKLRRFIGHDVEGKVADAFISFANLWVRSSFARLEISHKLAASLCLTDVPEDVDVRAPWDAWSMVLPNGLVQPDSGAAHANISRIWIVGTRPVFGVFTGGAIIRFPDSFPVAKNGEDPAVEASISALIRGACLALSNPDDFRKENQHGPTARGSHKSNRHGAPDLQQARFLLSAPVKVDLREHLRSVLSGKKGTSPTVQFLVRGHWRNQAHGPKNTLRKTMWIQPFWKGPEESRILLRQHRVEGP